MKQKQPTYQDYLIVIAFPDFYIQYHQVWHRVVCKFLGFTEGNTIRAGHNCVLSVNATTGKISYFDFGRYDVPDGFGRARSAETDSQLTIPLKANFRDGEITNLEQIIAWFYSMTSIHHSAGPLYCKVLNQMNEEKVIAFVHKTQKRGFVDYDIFRKGALNCSRYIGKMILAVVPSNRLTPYIKWICPSPTPLDTVINADRDLGVYRFLNKLELIPKMTPLDGIIYYLKSRGAYHNDTKRVEMLHLHWIGSEAMGSYYSLHSIDAVPQSLLIKKYSAKGTLNTTREYYTDQIGLNLNANYQLELGNTPEQLVVVQEGKRYRYWQKANHVTLH